MNYEKDQPWAWKSVVGGFLVYFQIAAIITSYSIIYDDVKTFYSVKASTASLLFAVLMGLRFLLGPVVVMIINVSGCDIVTVIGGLLIAFGIFIASCSPNIIWFLTSFGFFVGVGLSMSYISMSVILSELFDKRKSLAFGLTTLGFPVGYVTSPHIFTFLFLQYGFRSATMLLSAISLHTVIAGLLFSLPKHIKKMNGKQHLLNTENQFSEYPKLGRTLKTVKKCNFHMMPFKNPNFVCYILGVSCFIMGAMPWAPYIVDIIISDGEISLKLAVQVFTVDGIAQIISRFVASLLFDRIRKYRGIVVSLCCFFTAFVYPIIVTMSPNIYSYLILSLFRGYCVSTFFVQHIVILGDVCPPEQLHMSIGIMNFFIGIGTISGPVMSGLIRDRFSTYLETFLFLFAIQFLAGALMLFVFARKLLRKIPPGHINFR